MAKFTKSGEATRYLKHFGYQYGIVERFVSARQITIDYCGFADIIAFRLLTGTDLSRMPDLRQSTYEGCLAIQACAYSTLSEHYDKCTLGKPRHALLDWLLAGNRFEIWAFPSPRDKRLPKRFYGPKFRQVYPAEPTSFLFRECSELEGIGLDPTLPIGRRNPVPLVVVQK